MAVWKVPVARWYRARHIAFVEIEAETADEAFEAAEAAMLEDGSLDPESYSDTQDSEGYDDAGSWAPDDDRAVIPADADPDADLAEAAGDEVCTACHRPSLDCSRDPCPAVIEDRQ